MAPGATAAAGGRRGRVVGRRLPFTGDNFGPLADLTWQLHAYGERGRDGATRVGHELGLPVHVFGSPGETLLREGLIYLVRPDGFVAAAATAPVAAEAFRRAMPQRSGNRLEAVVHPAEERLG
jgi:hypothetical protein